MRLIHALLILVAVISLYGYEAPDAKEILRRSIKINEADWNTMPRYSYLERDITQKLDAKGHAKSETSKSFEAQMIEGSSYNKLVAVNGQPLSAFDWRKEENKIKTVTWIREHESTEIRILRIAKFRLEWRANHDLMKEMVDAFDVTLVGACAATQVRGITVSKRKTLNMTTANRAVNRRVMENQVCPSGEMPGRS